MRTKTMIGLLLCCILAAGNVTQVNASYNYNDWSLPVPSKDGYVVKENGVINKSYKVKK